MSLQPNPNRRIVALGMSLFCALLLLFLVGCDAQDSASSGSASIPVSQGKPTEVVVIGTQHFLTDMPEGYTPGHLRALLEKVAPDVLAVEAPTNVSDPWSHAPNELWRVTRPWAKQSDIEILPTAWNEPKYGQQIGGMIQGFQFWGNGAKHQKIEKEIQAKLAAQSNTCEHMNSSAYIESWRKYHAALHELSGKDTPWENWNAKIMKNIRDVCRKYPGQRVALVYGSAHSYYFLDQLAEDPNVELVSGEQFFP